MSLIHTVANIGMSIANKLVPLAKTKPTQAYDYFEAANNKMGQLEQMTIQFVEFCQRWVYIQTVFALAICCFALFRGKKGAEWATDTVIKVVLAVAGIMSLVTIVSFVCSLCVTDDPSTLTSLSPN
ncbi:MAG: hypothetical protein II244_06130 [Clostridia bacterium]|nr:hypothetical protein [Clostridia bacterium]